MNQSSAHTGVQNAIIARSLASLSILHGISEREIRERSERQKEREREIRERDRREIKDRSKRDSQKRPASHQTMKVKLHKIPFF